MIKEVLILALTIQCTFAACFYGWVEFKGSCFSFNTDALNWLSAQSSCQIYGARLFQVDTVQRQEWLQLQMAQRKIVDVWIGGTCRLHQSMWFWVPSYAQIKAYTNWMAGAPSSPTVEQCIHVYSGYGYKWNDASCVGARPYVCQRYVEDNYVCWINMLGGLQCSEDGRIPPDIYPLQGDVK